MRRLTESDLAETMDRRRVEAANALSAYPEAQQLRGLDRLLNDLDSGHGAADVDDQGDRLAFQERPDAHEAI